MQERQPAHPFFQGAILSCVIVLASAAFEQPTLAIPSKQVAGQELTLTCRVVGTGTDVNLSWTLRPGDITPATTCNPVPSTDYIACNSAYTFTPDRADDEMRITCSAMQPGSPTTRTDSDSLNLILPPPDIYPLIEGKDVVIDNETETWTCTVREAKPRVSLSWRLDGSNEIIDGTQSDTQEGSTYNSVNTLTIALTAPVSDTPRTLTCVMRQDIQQKQVDKQISVTYAPRVSVPTTQYTTREGVNVRLVCTVDARPAATVEWLKNGNPLDRTSGKYRNGDATNPTLEIVNPDEGDSDVYTFRATNDVGETVSQTITVTVEYKPRVRIPVSQYTVNESQQLTIPCEYQAQPAALTSVTWQYIDAVNIQTPVNTGLGSKYGGGTPDTPSLTIYNVQRSDAGGYTCRCDNEPGFGVSERTDVRVNFPPTNIKITPSAVFPKVGERAELTCTADAEPSPAYSWFLGEEQKGSQSKLVIDSAQRTDKGSYKCIASNMLGTADTVADISVHHKPHLTPESSSVAVDVGTDVTLECNIDANPIAFTVTWYKDSSLVDRSNARISGGTSVSSPSLVITNVQESDAGEYICTVNNLEGSSSITFILSISFPPRDVTITPSGGVINLQESESLTLTCSGAANPPPEFTWKAGSETLTTGPDLVITSAGPEDSRQVTCEVTNSKGSASATTTINVSYKPRVIIPGGDTYGADEGDSLTIPCDVHANPDVTVFDWLKDGSVLDLSDTSKYSGGTLEATNLTIESLSAGDAGQYNCRSENTVAVVTSRNITVSISYKPTQVAATPPAITVNTGEAFSVVCSADGAPSPALAWTKGGNSITEDAVLSVTSAQEENDGIYTCTASNDKGSDSVSVIVSVHYLPRVTSPSALVSGELGDAITIECEIKAKPEIDSVMWVMLNESSEVRVDTSNSSVYLGGTVLEPSLTILQLDAGHVGRYLCKANNSVGWGSGSPVTVMLSYAPSSIDLDPADVSVTEGERIAVTCSADGAPSPSYVWLVGGQQVASDGILVIASASPLHNAEYTCRATNKEGSAERAVQINVDYIPRGTEVNPTVTASIGQTVSLTCAVSANPGVTSYAWSFSGANLTETGPTLQVSEIEETNFGTYTCLATNSIGTSSPILIKLQKAGDLDTGASVVGASISTPILILIILLVIILIIIIVVVLVICYKKGKLCRKSEKSRIQPAEQPTSEVTPRPEDKPLPDAHGGLRSPQWSVSTASVVSRQHVSLEPDTQPRDKPQRLSFEDEVKPNGALTNGSIAGGTTISLPGDTPHPHHLPSLDRPPTEDKPKKKKKKRRKRKDLENVEEQGE